MFGSNGLELIVGATLFVMSVLCGLSLAGNLALWFTLLSWKSNNDYLEAQYESSVSSFDNLVSTTDFDKKRREVIEAFRKGVREMHIAKIKDLASKAFDDINDQLWLIDRLDNPEDYPGEEAKADGIASQSSDEDIKSAMEWISKDGGLNCKVPGATYLKMTVDDRIGAMTNMELAT